MTQSHDSSLNSDDSGLLVSRDLHAREVFLRRFTPTGHLTADVDRFLDGVGQHDVLARARQAGANRRQLAAEILENHQAELKRLADEQSPRWGGYARWGPEQLHLYQSLLDLESTVLRRILDS